MPGPSPAHRFYGRRQGRPLRQAQQALLDDLLPQVLVPDADRPDLGQLFPTARQVWLEIGFGGGEHLAWQAAANPDVGLIGCEPFVNGVVSCLKHVRDHRLANLRIWPDDARLLLERLPAASIDRAFLLFPDPWPKARHLKRRFVQAENLDRMARVLKPGAAFRMASDHADYAAQMLDETRRHPAFEWMALGPSDWRERPADWPATRYEQKALAGIPAFLSFRRI